MASLIDGKRGKILVYGGFRYHKNKETAIAIYWRCWQKACGASLKTNVFDINEETPVIQVLHESHHLHVEDEEKILKDRAMHRLKETVREDATRPIKRAFDAVVRGRHQQGGGDREPLPEFHSVRTLMQRARSTVVPPIPQHITGHLPISSAYDKTSSYLISISQDIFLSHQHDIHRTSSYPISISQDIFLAHQHMTGHLILSAYHRTSSYLISMHTEDIFLSH
ncbi:hypothetical protein PoB_005658200 [Plakobranchus ocellatus]|uniref:FLYWCH-type domain-containing protein n=1 Tax=Plakobranchus ocellatus TaxID=259542 RepID=A0AAV4CFN8_9GAST|nr:hypothetical protein PoB_005658200 [Plakobranchus ocellatus]